MANYYNPLSVLNNNDQALGFQLQDSFYDAILYSNNEIYNQSTVRKASNEEDKYSGTDFFITSLPVDVTYNAQGKNNYYHLGTIFSGIVNGCGYYDWTVGIRTGNAVHAFDKPVLVLGLKADTKIVKAMANHWEHNMSNVIAVIEAAMDAYWDGIDEIEKDIAEGKCDKYSALLKCGFKGEWS